MNKIGLEALLESGYNSENAPAITKLVAFASAGPGLEFGNYGNLTAYNVERCNITRDWHRFRRALVRAKALEITDKDVTIAAPHAFSGRLSWQPIAPHEYDWDYTTGQYFPTEYRKAAASVLEYAITTKLKARGNKSTVQVPQ